MISSDLVGKLQRSNDVPWDVRLFDAPSGGIPDFAWPHRLGPFAQVYRWRDPHRRQFESALCVDPARHGSVPAVDRPEHSARDHPECR